MWVVMGRYGDDDDQSTWILCACASEDGAKRIKKAALAEAAALRRATWRMNRKGMDYYKLCEARTVDRTDTGKTEYGDYWVQKVEVRS